MEGDKSQRIGNTFIHLFSVTIEHIKYKLALITQRIYKFGDVLALEDVVNFDWWRQRKTLSI